MSDPVIALLATLGVTLMFLGVPGALLALDVVEERGHRVGALAKTAGVAVGFVVMAGGVCLGYWATRG